MLIMRTSRAAEKQRNSWIHVSINRPPLAGFAANSPDLPAHAVVAADEQDAASSSRCRFAASAEAFSVPELSPAAIVARPTPKPFNGLCQRTPPVNGSRQKISP